MSEPQLEPDVSEVLQEEAPEAMTAVPTIVEKVCTPVRVQVLPRKGGSTRTRTVTTAPVRLLTADARRASAVVMSLVLAESIAVAYSQAAAQDLSSMSEWPALEPFTCTATTEVWVRAVTGTARVSVTTERWAEG